MAEEDDGSGRCHISLHRVGSLLQYCIGKLTPQPQYFKSVQYASNSRSELKALVEREQYYIFFCFCFCIIIQRMTLCKKVHTEAEFVGRNYTFFLKAVGKQALRSLGSVLLSLLPWSVHSFLSSTSAQSYNKPRPTPILAGCILAPRQHLSKVA